MFLRRLPLYRGKMRNKPFRNSALVLNLSALSKIPKNTVVTIDTLVAYHLVDEATARRDGVKLLGDGAIENALTIQIPCSASAKTKIEAAGGQVG